MSDAQPAISVLDLRKEYSLGQVTVQALSGVTFDVPPGSFISVVGPSGSGKSTLLHLIAGLERPSGGEVHVNGTHVSALGDEASTVFRRRHIGVVFQFFNLLRDLTVYDNVAVPLMLDGVDRREVDARVATTLASVGLADFVTRFPGELSGGEMQRVAIARALAVRPALLLADEPTGNLDSSNGSRVLELMHRACVEQKQTTMLVTHDMRLTKGSSRVLELLDGRLAG